MPRTHLDPCSRVLHTSNASIRSTGNACFHASFTISNELRLVPLFSVIKVVRPSFIVIEMRVHIKNTTLFVSGAGHPAYRPMSAALPI